MDRTIPFLHDYIILDPPAFVQEMDILYYLEFHAKSLPADLDAEVGIMIQSCRTLLVLIKFMLFFSVGQKYKDGYRYRSFS